MNAHGTSTGPRGRPEVTSHAEIEKVAFAAFSEQGFARITMDEIARRVGISRRTLFRYYPSKNDIPWGRFEKTLEHFRWLLEQQPRDGAVYEAVHQAVIEFNRFPADARPSHRERMQLILTTPELQAHSVLRYAEWRQVIVDYVASRTSRPADDILPVVAGYAALSLSLAAYEVWLEHSDKVDDIPAYIDRAMASLRSYLAV